MNRESVEVIIDRILNKYYYEHHDKDVFRNDLIDALEEERNSVDDLVDFFND